MNKEKQPRAVALISGGLDSMLAARSVIEQGVHVEGLNFFTGFCVEGHTHALRNKHKEKKKRNNALWVAEQLNIKLHIIDIVEEYKNIVINPKHGYGAHLNPCLDCKVFMVRKAKEWMDEYHFDFIITGEVIGQRPNSQLKAKMPIVAQESGADDRLLRPLCAKLLTPTLPEKEGWVEREKLFDFSGRSRKPQMALADQYGFDEYAQPAGGCCFLTNEHYAAKLADLWHYRGKKDYEIDDIMLLKVGRHLRPNDRFKMIVGRELGENNYLEGYRSQFVNLQSISHQGPLVLIDGEADAQDLNLAARILAKFSDGGETEQVSVRIETLSGTNWVVDVQPLTAEEIPDEWYIK